MLQIAIIHLVLFTYMINVIGFTSNPNDFTGKCRQTVLRPNRFLMSSSPEYRNKLTEAFSTFISGSSKSSFLDKIDWNEKKNPKIPKSILASVLERELIQKEWFVTGNVQPKYFSNNFSFQDPDVKVKGIEAYARGVNKIFSQKDARAEIIAVRVNDTIPDTITAAWRLSGSVNLGFGLKLKPFIVYTDFRICSSDGLIIFQEDRFDIKGYDIVLSSLFPALASFFFGPPAASIDVLRNEYIAREKESRVKFR